MDIVAQQFGWPEGLQRGITLVLVLGLLVTLLLAWFHGERGAQRVSGTELVLLALLLAGGGVVLWRFAVTPPAVVPAAEVQPPGGPPASSVNPKSIAVMPFRDLSGGPDAGLIADGFSEEVINSLSRVPDLQVAARSSSFALRDGTLSAIDIGDRLQVAHVLEGSVRRSGNRLRITTQLIRASDGINVWSQDYDRTDDDIIAIQEEVARSIAQALKTVADPAMLADMQRAGTRVVPAYDAYLKGLGLRNQALGSGDYAGYDRALAAFDEAIALDPGFPEAHQQAIALNNSDPSRFRAPGVVATPLEQTLADLGRRLDRAGREVRDRSQAHMYLAWRAWIDLRFSDAQQHVQRFLADHPTDTVAVALASDVAYIQRDLERFRELAERSFATADDPGATGAAMTAMARLPDPARSVEMARAGLERFPGNSDTAYQAQRVFLTAGFVREAAALVPVLLAGELLDDTKALVQMRQACAEGRRADAEALYAKTVQHSPDRLVRWHGLLLLGRDQEAAELLSIYNRPETLSSLSGLLVYPNFDVRDFPRLAQALESQGIPVGPPRPEPYKCPE